MHIGVTHAMSIPKQVNKLSAYCIPCQQWGLSYQQHRALIATDLKHSMQPIAHQLFVSSIFSKYIHSRLNSIIKTINLIPSWMRAEHPFIYSPSAIQDRSPDSQDTGVLLSKKLIQLPQLLLQVLTWWNRVIATCELHSWRVTEETHHLTWHIHCDDQWTCWVACWDNHPDPSHE